MSLQEKLAKWRETASPRLDFRLEVPLDRYEALLDVAAALDAVLRSQALKESQYYNYSEAILNGSEALRRLGEIEDQ